MVTQAKVYLLPEAVKGNRDNLAATIKGMTGVSAINILDFQPDLLAVIEAPERQEVAKHLMRLLDMIDGAVEDIRVLPVQKSADTT